MATPPPTPALPDAALDQLFRTARSYNGYTDAPVTEADVRAIYDLVKMGPTSANQQPARLVWCLTADARERLAAHASDSNAAKIRQAPASVVVAYDREFHDHLPTLFPHVDARPWFADADQRAGSAALNATLQAAYLIVAARALGFDTGPMTGIDAAGIDAAFFADEPHWRTVMVTTLGRGDPASIFGRLPRPAFELFNRIA